MFAVIDADQIGQAIIGACVVGGFLVNQWRAHQRAEAVEKKAVEKADAVAAVAETAAAAVAEKVEHAGTETRQQLQEIHLMVDGRLDEALRALKAVQAEVDALKGDSPGTAAHDAGPQVLGPEHKLDPGE